MSKKKAAKKRDSSTPAAPVPRRRLPLVPVALALGGLVLVGVAVGAVYLVLQQMNASGGSGTPAVLPQVPLAGATALETVSDEKVYAAYAGSESCRECHRNAYTDWKTSNHGLAERKLDPAMDDPAFVPPRTFKHGTQTTDVLQVDGKDEVVTLGFDNKREPYTVDRVIGNNPLRQFLVAIGKGRQQTLEASWDPVKHEWFDVYGSEDRKPGEWGHWTGRGMNWNSMCASCHNTRLRKNYDARDDTYSTAMAEMSVGCEACHGPMKDHVDWQKQYAGQSQGSKMKDPTLVKFSPDQWLHTCGSCHARRRDYTGEFVPGDSFFDHFAVSIPDSTDFFYPDGQIHEEDYEFTSFLSSRMHASNVRCNNCHNPHTAKTIFQGNDLCMACHNASFPKSPKIDPATHTFHKPDGAGYLCVNCHMPQTVYMQRHWRHDHGFTIPDPLLTKKFNIPNACNRCHKDKDADWALAACDKWYGAKMDRPTRTRAIIIAEGRRGDASARDGLLKVLADEPIPLWQASAAALLGRGNYLAQAVVQEALIKACGHADPMVRENAIRAIEPLAQGGDPRAIAAIRPHLMDPARNVRVTAAWALRQGLDPASVAGRDLLMSLAFNSDQPPGAMNRGIWDMLQRNLPDAAKWFARAGDWDQHSAAPHDALAVVYSMLGRPQDALAQMKLAAKLDPGEPEYWFKLGLAYNEVGDVAETARALEQAVKLNPRHASAWYNLGLAYSAGGSTGKAIDALSRAETLEPGNPRIPYAAATILAKMGRKEQARAAAIRALRADPTYRQAMELLQQLQ